MGNSVPKFVTNSCASVKETYHRVKKGYEGIKMTFKTMKSVYDMTRSFETSKFAETNDPNDIIDAIYKTESDIPGKYKDLLKVIPADTLKKITNILFETFTKSRGASPSPKNEGPDRPAADTEFPIPDLTTKESVSEAIGRMTDAITGTYDRSERNSGPSPQNWSSQPEYVHPDPPTPINDNPEYSEMKSDDDRDSGFGNLNDDNEKERRKDSGPFGMRNENINYQQTPNYENQSSFDSVDTSKYSSEANSYYKPESDNSYNQNQTEEAQKEETKELPPLTKRLGEVPGVPSRVTFVTELHKRFGPEWRKRVPSFVHEPTSDSIPDLGLGLGKEGNKDNVIEMYDKNFDLGHQDCLSLYTEQDKTYRGRSNNKYDDRSTGIIPYYAPRDKTTEKSDQPTESRHKFADKTDNFINQSSPPFQVEDGIYISELMKESNLLLEELRLYENRAECNVRKKTGQLQKIIVQRNPQAPYQFPISYAILNEKGSLVKTSGSQFQFLDRKGSYATPARYGPPTPVIKSSENNLNNISYKENPLPVRDRLKSKDKGSSSGDGFPGFYFAHDKPSRQYSIFKSCDLSLFEETRQFKIGDDTTIERYQRYKIRPTGDRLKKVPESQVKESEKAVIDAEVSLDEQGYIEKQNEPGVLNKIEQNNENILPYKLSYVSSSGSDHLRLEKDANLTENSLKYSQQNQSGWAANKGTTQESSTFQQRAVIPHIIFTKPRVGRFLSNNIKRFLFSKKSEIKVSASEIKSASSERLSNICSFAKLETFGISKTNETCSENTDGYKQSVFHRKLIDETSTGKTKYLPVKSEFEEDTKNSYQVQNSVYSNNQVREGNSIAVLKSDANSHLQERVLRIPKSTHGSSVKTQNKDDISFFLDYQTRGTKGSYDIKNENKSFEPIIIYKTNDKEVRAGVQKVKETVLNIVDIKEPTFNPFSLHASQSHIKDENSQLLINNINSVAKNAVTKSSVVCELSTQISSDEIESIGHTFEPVSLIIEEAPKVNTTEGVIHKIGYSSETKDQKLVRLQEQIGKVSITNEKAFLPPSEDVIMTQSINNSDSDKEKQTPSILVEENLVKRQSSNWNYKIKGEDGEENTRVTTQFKSNTVVNEEIEMRRTESKSEDSDQCSIM